MAINGSYGYIMVNNISVSKYIQILENIGVYWYIQVKNVKQMLIYEYI